MLFRERTKRVNAYQDDDAWTIEYPNGRVGRMDNNAFHQTYEPLKLLGEVWYPCLRGMNKESIGQECYISGKGYQGFGTIFGFEDELEVIDGEYVLLEHYHVMVLLDGVVHRHKTEGFFWNTNEQFIAKMKQHLANNA